MYTQVQNFNGHQTYQRFKILSNTFIEIAQSHNINIKSEDIRIRVKQRNEVCIIFNVYSSKEENMIKALRSNFLKTIEKTYKNYKVEILIDKKKLSIKTIPSLCLTSILCAQYKK